VPQVSSVNSTGVWFRAAHDGPGNSGTSFVLEGGVMSVIKPRTRGKRLVKHNVRLDEQNQQTLYAYAYFLGESTEYVLNQLIDTVLAKDKEFVRWRADHPQSCVPRPMVRRRTRLGSNGVLSIS
jgi:hypothetical protein